MLVNRQNKQQVEQYFYLTVHRDFINTQEKEGTEKML